MITDEDDWIEIDEDAPATLDPNSRRGVLVVAAKAANAEEMAVEERWYLNQGDLANLVIFEEPDTEDGISHVTNVESFRGHGYEGSDDPAELEQWLAASPRDTASEQRFLADILAARGIESWTPQR